MNTTEINQTEKMKMGAPPSEKPSVFSYVCFREFLRDAYNYKNHLNPSFSENAFTQAAGFGKSSRGYLGLLIKGKRNLTAQTIFGFSKALKLSPKETMYCRCPDGGTW